MQRDQQATISTTPETLMILASLLEKLKDLIASNRPRIVVLCGAEPLRYILTSLQKIKSLNGELTG